MTIPHEKRDQLVSEFNRIGQQFNKLTTGARRLPRRKFDEFNERQKEIKADYFADLPIVTLSCCPFCNTEFKRRFDPWSTDGVWWQATELTVELDEPNACQHFSLLRGALRFNNKKLEIGSSTSYLGPAVPYVVPEIMKLPTMKAVVSEFAMDCGYTAFPVAYFSVEKPAPGKLMQEWRKKTYGWKNEQGEPFWSAPQYPWDFDLSKWIASEQLGWVDLSNPKPIVQFGTPEECPYLNLEGTRQRQVFERGELILLDPPSGEEFSPFE